ncbi:hypothetical protein CASFOL_026822 [Castilleja foliolosa]|uniref:RING-type E3 ubiquitin transferase n=1 Tax=Castilleja foliolosa TaxID=1961234 RepID=A0ABD3CI60_9LAMI
MGSEFGYEYHYDFSLVDEDEINSKYKSAASPKSNGARILLFDIRTKFIAVLRTDKEGEERVLIDSEKYDTALYEDEPDDVFLRIHVFNRLDDYWMTIPELYKFTRSAFDFAKQMSSDPANANLRLIPVVVSFEVCTVQKEGESNEAVMERAICSRRLIPLYLYPIPTITEMPLKPIDDHVKLFLKAMDRVRVEDTDQELARIMSVCYFCSKRACFGAQITLLECKHAFHSHCIARWLEDSNLCPLCDKFVYLRLNSTPECLIHII